MDSPSCASVARMRRRAARASYNETSVQRPTLRDTGGRLPFPRFGSEADIRRALGMYDPDIERGSASP
jgi:hypothetical protein